MIKNFVQLKEDLNNRSTSICNAFPFKFIDALTDLCTLSICISFLFFICIFLLIAGIAALITLSWLSISDISSHYNALVTPALSPVAYLVIAMSLLVVITSYLLSSKGKENDKKWIKYNEIEKKALKKLRKSWEDNFSDSNICFQTTFKLLSIPEKLNGHYVLIPFETFEFFPSMERKDPIFFSEQDMDDLFLNAIPNDENENLEFFTQSRTFFKNTALKLHSTRVQIENTRKLLKKYRRHFNLSSIDLFDLYELEKELYYNYLLQFFQSDRIRRYEDFIEENLGREVLKSFHILDIIDPSKKIKRLRKKNMIIVPKDTKPTVPTVEPIEIEQYGDSS